MTRHIASIVLFLGGLILVGLNANWWVAVGMFMMIWGNNINIINRVIQLLIELTKISK